MQTLDSANLERTRHQVYCGWFCSKLKTENNSLYKNPKRSQGTPAGLFKRLDLLQGLELVLNIIMVSRMEIDGRQ